MTVQNRNPRFAIEGAALRRFLFASSVALAVPFALPGAAEARPPMGGDAMEAEGHPMHRHGRGEWGEGRHLPPFLRGVKLTETQRDRIFEILHAQAPAFRAKGKEVRQARQDLMQLAMTPEFDETKARPLADAAAKAMTELAVMRARTGSQIYAVLTPEQRKQVEEQRTRMEPRG